jgi:hypothetical protein
LFPFWETLGSTAGREAHNPSYPKRVETAKKKALAFMAATPSSSINLAQARTQAASSTNRGKEPTPV